MWPNKVAVFLVSQALVGCSTTGVSVCYYEGMKLSDRMAVRDCEQALARKEDYKTSSGNSYMQPNGRLLDLPGGTVIIQEQKYGIQTGRTFAVKK